MAKCYIAGPMRSRMDFNYPAFYEAEARLQQSGWEVWNPARLGDFQVPKGLTLEAQEKISSDPAIARAFADRDLQVTINKLRGEEGDAIVVLDGWEDSIGATAEIGVARWVGLRVLTLEEATAAAPEERCAICLAPKNSSRHMNGSAFAECTYTAWGPGPLYNEQNPYQPHVEPHHFHPGDDPSMCRKCGGGLHGLVEVPQRLAGWDDVSIDVLQPSKVYGMTDIPKETGEYVYFTNAIGVATAEQKEVLDIFCKRLAAVLADGGRKRAKGEKPSWKVDNSHLAAIFSHLNKYFHSERVDADSGHHPFDHLACRALMIAWQQTQRGEMALTMEGSGWDGVTHQVSV